MIDHIKIPEAVELEEAVIGAMLLDDQSYDQACDIIKSPCIFFKPAHQTIYNTIKKLRTVGSAVDILLVVQELKNIGKLEYCGGAYYISQLTNRVASASNIEFHARIIVQKYVQRVMITSSQHLLMVSQQDGADIFEIVKKLSQVQEQVDEIISGGANTIESLNELADDVMPRYEERKAAHQRKEMIGCPTGFVDLDEATGGWQDSDVNVLAARPSMGKTAMLLKFAKTAASSGRYAVLVFSLEMRKAQLVDRIFTGEAEDVNPTSFRHGRMNSMEEEFSMGTIKKMKGLPIYIDDTIGLSPAQLLSRVKRLKRKLKSSNPDLKLLVEVDYLGLMESDDRHHNREDEISKISRQLKKIAKLTGDPYIVLSQLNRQVESRGGSKRPQLSDLRDSGAVEQDADMVLFLHRPEYYGITEGPGGQSTKGVGEIIIAKNRHGPVTVYDGQFAFFYNTTMTSITDPNAGRAILPNNEFLNINQPDPF